MEYRNYKDWEELKKELDRGELIASTLRLKIDKKGLPTLSLSTPSRLIRKWYSCAYYIQNLFKKENRDEIRRINRFRRYLEELYVHIKLDEATGKPTFDVYRFHIFSHEDICIVTDDPKTEAQPIVVKRKKGTVIYNIQNITINISADVVNQLNMNPQQVVNIIHDQLEEKLDDMVKKHFPL